MNNNKDEIDYYEHTYFRSALKKEHDLIAAYHQTPEGKVELAAMTEADRDYAHQNRMCEKCANTEITPKELNNMFNLGGIDVAEYFMYLAGKRLEQSGRYLE